MEVRRGGGSGGRGANKMDGCSPSPPFECAFRCDGWTGGWAVGWGRVVAAATYTTHDACGIGWSSQQSTAGERREGAARPLHRDFAAAAYQPVPSSPSPPPVHCTQPFSP